MEHLCANVLIAGHRSGAKHHMYPAGPVNKTRAPGPAPEGRPGPVSQQSAGKQATSPNAADCGQNDASSAIAAMSYYGGLIRNKYSVSHTGMPMPIMIMSLPGPGPVALCHANRSGSRSIRESQESRLSSCRQFHCKGFLSLHWPAREVELCEEARPPRAIDVLQRLDRRPGARARDGVGAAVVA